MHPLQSISEYPVNLVPVVAQEPDLSFAFWSNIQFTWFFWMVQQIMDWVWQVLVKVLKVFHLELFCFWLQKYCFIIEHSLKTEADCYYTIGILWGSHSSINCFFPGTSRHGCSFSCRWVLNPSGCTKQRGMVSVVELLQIECCRWSWALMLGGAMDYWIIFGWWGCFLNIRWSPTIILWYIFANLKVSPSPIYTTLYFVKGVSMHKASTFNNVKLICTIWPKRTSISFFACSRAASFSAIIFTYKWMCGG